MKWIVVVIAVLAAICGSSEGARKLKGSTDVDALRHRYLELESRAMTIVNQMDKVENQKEEDRAATRNIVLKELIEIYSGFANNDLGPDDTYNEEDYEILTRFYEWQLLQSDLINVHKLFDAFRQFMRNKNQLPRDDPDLELASLDLTDTVLSDPHFPVNGTLDQIDTIMVRQGVYYKAQLEAKSTICSFGLSAQQVLYQLYNAISITELKGYSMMQFSWMLLKAYGKGNFTAEAKLMRRRFEDRTNRTQLLLQQVMRQASRDYWRCDPERNQQKEGETFVQITRLLQGYVENEVDSWWRWLFWHCSYCFCLCDDAGKNSDRYINMRESVSDVMDNKVVTGMRFVKKNRIIHLIIQQGRLLPRGQIDNTTLEWVQPEDYNVLSPNVRNGRDYHTLNRDNRILDLDDLDVLQGYVLTGVRFRLLGSHLNLEIRMTEMDFATGYLMDPDKSIWTGSDKTEHSDDKRTEVKLDRPHVPLLTPSKSIPDSISNQFIRFRESDRGMDAAQTTVPFFDAQPVVPAKPVPLSGAGLFHKGRPKFGGFVAPKVMTYDFGPHVQAPIDQADSEARRLPALN